MKKNNTQEICLSNIKKNKSQNKRFKSKKKKD